MVILMKEEAIVGFKAVLPLELSGESAKYPQRFNELGVEFSNKQCTNDEEFIELAKDADAVITVGSIRPVPRNVIEKLDRCRLISNTQIGYDSIDVEAATERGILVTNVPDYCVEEVSDHAMALILACSRRIVQLNQAAKRGQWGLSPDGIEVQSRIWPHLSRLKGQTLGLFGLGKVARALVPKARSFGLGIIAYDPYVPEGLKRQLGVATADWKRILKESDFLSIHAALTSETRQIFSIDAFRGMKPTACLINTSRGGLIDEPALFQALRDGFITMAALDVTDPEPPETNNPLLNMDNVIITAHSAFFSPVSEAERWQRPAGEVALVMNKRWPRDVVNPQAKEKYVLRWGKMEV